MKYLIFTLTLSVLIFQASCNILNPSANQVTVEASNTSGISCPVIVNLDGNNGVTITSGTSYTFPLTGSGSHTLNFSTNGQGGTSNNCVYQNNNNANYSQTFNTSGGNVYVGTVSKGTNGYQLSVTIN